MSIKKFYINKVAFPHEHGSWGLFLEPIILALVVSYSSEGLLIAISSFSLFLANQSASIVLRKSPKYLLTSAKMLLIIYLVIAVSLMAIIIFDNVNKYFLIPYFTAVLIMLYYKLMELRNLNRNIIIELLAPFSVLLIAISMLMNTSWGTLPLIAFSFVVLSRSIQTVFYVNNKLKFFKGHSTNKKQVNYIGLLFLVILTVFAGFGLSPYLSVIAILILIFRAYLGLLAKNKNEKVKVVGIKEFIYGFLFVVINIFGYVFKL